MFGETLKQLRMQKNETQEDIANLTGVHFSTVSSWERNQAEPSYEKLKILASHYKVTTDYLLNFDSEDFDKLKNLRNALIHSGINSKEGLEKAMQILEVLKEQK